MTNGDGGSGSKIDPSSPYYLGPQDKPGDSITHIRLTLDNFDEWAHEVRVALKSRRKYVFVNGVINEPKPPCTDDDWETIHSMLVAWLSRTISPEVRALLPKFENAKSLWDALQERFGVVDGSRIHQIQAGLRDCQQSEGMYVTVYYGKLCQLWDDLDKHQPIIECKCCSGCTSAKQHLERRESDRLHQFLLGLHAVQYGSLRSVILAQNPLPTVARAFNMVCQEERVRGLGKPPEAPTEIASFNVRSQSPIPNKPPSQMSRTERQSLYCNHCKRNGHDRSMCFDLTGEVPDWYYELKSQRRGAGRGSSTRGRGGGRGSGNVPRSQQEGGSRGDGFQQSDSSNAVHTTSPTSPANTSQMASTSSASSVTVYGTPTHDHSGKWLIDTGCSHHVTGNYALLCDVRNISNRVVGLPDGSKILACLVGRVDVTPNISLDPVLYVPQLTCNLISASQLSDALHCDVITNANSCTIQDRDTREAIGTGERLDGLYYLRQKPEEVNLVTSGSSVFKLWHNRLGHPSEKIVKLLPFLRNSKHSLSQPCEGGLPIRFWGECALAAAFVINRTPSRLLNDATPYELIFKRPPNFDILRVFGSLCFAHNQKSKGDKFASRSRKCVSWGIPPDRKNNENDLLINWDDELIATDTNDHVDTPPGTPAPNNGSPMTGPAGPTSDISPPSPPMGRGHRSKIPTTTLRDYVLNFDSDDDNDSSPSSAAPLRVSMPTSGTPYPLANYLSCKKFSSPHRSYLAALTTHNEPRNYKEAAQSAAWRQAMETEMKALVDNKTWVLEPLPPSKKALGSKWLYKIKYKSDSTIERFKARLVVFGNHQTEGVDYDETFAPVAKMTTVRAFLTVAAANKWHLH
ncbi:uncharacterized protein LOC141627793 [Silene latifolia]|uniref:uncharacterized protein LOC141627793 n=1 Tax=Silene latifolia TaxID=37657 RepID=UPI003D76A8EE